jgi:glycosyltransferase involved in cell wall biosynthesis
MNVLVVVPAFNESKNVPHVIADLRTNCPHWDILVIDDGSTDPTFDAALRAGANAIRLPFNLGIGGAVQTGLLYALRHRYDVCLQVDGDGQHSATESLRLVEALTSTRADIVVGSRFLAMGGFRSSPIRRMGIRLLAGTLSWLIRSPVTDPTSGHRALSARALTTLAGCYPQEYPEPESLFMAHQYGLRVHEFPVTMRARRYGRSSIGWASSVIYMAQVLLAILIRSTQPRVFRRS